LSEIPLEALGRALVVFAAVMATSGALLIAERRVAAFMQYRLGPNRVGPFGLLQPLADTLKFFFKESPVPAGADPILFRLAPVLAALPSLVTFCVIPLAPPSPGGERPFVAADLEVGGLFVLAVSSLSVLGILLAAWSSNNKYGLLGGLRASAQLVSYEIALVLSVLAILASCGSLRLWDVVLAQDGLWNAARQPVAFAAFVVAAFAETNRHPFDFAECEPELVAGYHTEYGGTRFMLFYVGEYAAMTTMAGLGTTLFLGGPDVPFLALEKTPFLLGLASFAAKTAAFLFLYIWVRWTLPRLTFDRLMRFGWKVLLPATLANLVVTGLLAG
jgi:NADH-quinone oxidoreductase subunit H